MGSNRSRKLSNGDTRFLKGRFFQGKMDLWVKWSGMDTKFVKNKGFQTKNSSIADINMVGLTINHEKCNYKLINV